MKVTRTLAAAAFLVASAGASAAPAAAEPDAPDAATIIRKMEAAMRPASDRTANFEIVVRGDAGREVHWKGTMLRRKKGAPEALMVFSSPKDVKGIELAVVSTGEGMDVMRFYLPALDRTRTLRTGMLGESFLGTDFAFENLGLEELDAESHELVGTGEVNGRPVWKVESKPEEGLWYGRIVRSIDRETHLPLRTEYWDRAGTLYKVATIDETKNIDGHPTALAITMKTVADSKSGGTMLRLSNVRYDTGLDDEAFASSVLGRRAARSSSVAGGS